MESVTMEPSIVTLSEAERLEQLNGEVRSAALPVIVFDSILCVFGFFGNLFVLYVFLFRYKSCNFRYFVLCLCLTDLTSSLTTIPGEVVTQMFWYMYPDRMLCKVKSFFNVFTVCAEAFCLLTISIDRHRKVCRPHGWQIKPRVALILCVVVYVVAFILALPVSFFWGTHNEVVNNITVTKCEKDQRYLDSDQPVAYSASVQGIVSMCLVVMLILYILVARTLLKNKKSNSTPLKRKPTQPEFTTISKNTLSPNTAIPDGMRTEGSESGYSTYVDAECGQDAASRDTDGRTDDETYTNSDMETVTDIRREGNKNKPAQCNKTRRHRRTTDMATRIQRKTRITFILSIVFIITTILYFTLLDLIAENILPTLNSSEKAAYFFFFRLVFINHVINPFVYGVLDPQFRKEMRKLYNKLIDTCCCCFSKEK